MKTATAILAAALLMLGAAASVTSCSGTKNADAQEVDAPVVLSIDSVMATPEAFVGDTITVEGLCTHLCAHGARKAFLTNADTTLMLRCQAGQAIGAFDRTAIGQIITVSGVLRAQEMGLGTLEQFAAAEAKPDTTAAAHCDTEQRASGTATAWLEKLREQIAAGGDTTIVVSYYLDADSYGVPEN